ncbi:hypothetical protein ACFSHR_19400 [Azotobacter chroococcum]
MLKTPFRISGLWPALLLWTLGAALPAGAAQENQAVIALLKSAIEEFSAGRPEQAASALERGLRIEPNNAILWHYRDRPACIRGIIRRPGPWPPSPTP